jgi:hypothetical protein
MPSDFSHVSDAVVRRILLNHPRALRLSEVFEAVERSICALGHDAIREDIPAHAFEQRRQAAKEAFVRITRGHKTRAWQALHRFWLV